MEKKKIFAKPKEPLTLGAIKETNSESRLLMAIFLKDRSRLIVELAPSAEGGSGANPLEGLQAEMRIKGAKGESGDSDSFYKSALAFCGGVCCETEIFEKVARAGREIWDNNNKSKYRSKKDICSFDGQMGESIKLAITMLKRYETTPQNNYAWHQPWTTHSLDERVDFISRAIGLMTTGEMVPWDELAERDELARPLQTAIDLWATNPERAGLALAACVKNKRIEEARRVLKSSGGSVDTAPAIMAALGTGDQDLAARLSQPLHAWAIAGGRKGWIEIELSKSDTAWVNQSACHAKAWGPLSAALDEGDLELARRLVEKGASPNAMTEIDPEDAKGRTAPLLSARAVAGDEAGCRMLLAAGAYPGAFDASWTMSDGLATSAAGAAALHGHEGVARLALMLGASMEEVGRPALARLARERPDIRELFGKEGALSYFGRRVQEAAQKASSALRPAAGLRGLLGRGKAEQAEAPEPPKSFQIGEALKEFRQSGAKSAAPGLMSMTDSEELSLAKARAGFDALELDKERADRALALMAQAVELAPQGRLRAEGADAKDLKRLWELNVPLLLGAIEAIPKEDRSSGGEEGESSAWESLDETMESAKKAMEGMRSRALRQARVRVEAEKSVIQANAELSVQREETPLSVDEMEAVRSATRVGGVSKPVL